MPVLVYGRNGDYCQAAKEKTSFKIVCEPNPRVAYNLLFRKAREINAAGQPVIVIGARHDEGYARCSFKEETERLTVRTEHEAVTFAEDCQNKTDVIVFLHEQFHFAYDMKFPTEAVCLVYMDSKRLWSYEKLMQAFARAARSMTTFLGHAFIRADASWKKTYESRYARETAGDFADGAEIIRIANGLVKMRDQDKPWLAENVSADWCQELSSFFLDWKPQVQLAATKAGEKVTE